ncbi:MAG: pseudouridine synthase [Thermoflexales bacterium]
MRLQQFLSRAGYGARRKCEQLILANRVMVNGRPAKLGMTVQPTDEVRVDGVLARQAEPKVYIALHKPVGYVSDRSNPGARSVFELVRLPYHLFGVGRLDKDSSGLLLLTNDGDFAYRLTHPRFAHEKEYHVVVEGTPDEVALQRWRQGVWLPGEQHRTLPCQVEVLKRQDVPPRATLRVVMREGRKRQIRRIARLLGYPVVSLVRVRIGGLWLGALQSGAWRYLHPEEVAMLTGEPPGGGSDDQPCSHDRH